jgi:hypothetical protein
MFLVSMFEVILRSMQNVYPIPPLPLSNNRIGLNIYNPFTFG